MIQYLDKITVIPSYALKEQHLEFLIGNVGKIVEIIQHTDIITGCWVQFPTPIRGEKEWFIPYSSIIC